jgi:hypothetical protein
MCDGPPPEEVEVASTLPPLAPTMTPGGKRAK